MEKIRELFNARGSSSYFGEAVTQQEHALQAAYLAERENAPDALVVAALLHDIGHLLQTQGEDAADRGVDARHETLGEKWLSLSFGPEVTEPVRLHVAAKRYLCTTCSDYLASLSAASVQSLALQGGPFTDAECREFEALPYYNDAVKLRLWDDEAKVVDLAVPGLNHYMPRIAEVLRKRLAS